MTKIIYVYADEGVGPHALRNTIRALKEDLPDIYSIKRLDKNEIADPSWCDEASLLLFPGGRDVFYHRDLQGSPNSLIRDYVRKGGCYLGLCAGAYYGAATIVFEEGSPLEIIEQRELAFFPGEARGPAYGNGVFRYGSESGARLCSLEWMAEKYEKRRSYVAYFNGGCSFVDADDKENVTVLARYSDIEGEPAAIIECSVGEGKAILCGAHPEYAANDLDVRDPYLAPIQSRLALSDFERKNLLAKIFSRLIQN